MKESPGNAPIKVLIIDDEPAILDISKEFLETFHGMTVTTLERSTEAMELISGERFDAIISDYQMPDMDGLALLKEVRSRGLDIPFILFTGKGREEVAIEALNEGVDFYVYKGGDPRSQYSELAHKVQRAVSDRTNERLIIYERERQRVALDIHKMVDEPEERIFRYALNAVVNLCQGKRGSIEFLQGSERKLMTYEFGSIEADQAITDTMMDIHILDPPSGDEPWNGHRPIIVNGVQRPDVHGTMAPKNCSVFNNFISVPILDAGETVMLFAVGDKSSDFNEQDVYQTTLLMNGVWEMIRRKRSEEHLEKSLRELRTQHDWLMESESRFRALFERSSNGITLTDDRFLEVNSVFARMLGYTPQEMVGMEAWQISPEMQPNGQPSMTESQKMITRALDDVITQFEWTHQTKDGKLVECEVLLQKVMMRGHDLLLAFIHDVSALKKEQRMRRFIYDVAEAVQTSTDRDQLLQTIFRSLSEMIVLDNFYVGLFDQENDTVTFPLVKDAVEWTHRHRKGGNGFTEYLIRRGRPMLLDRKEQESLLESGEVALKGKLAEEWMGVPLKIADRTVGIIAAQNYSPPRRFTSDDLELMTFVADQVILALERMAAKEVKVRTESLLQCTLDSTLDGIVVIDNEFNVLLANHAAHEILGVPQGTLVGKSSLRIDDLLPGGMANCDILDSLMNAVDKADLSVSRHTCSSKDRRSFDFTFSPYMVDGDKHGYIWTITEVTDKKKIEQELRMSESRMKTLMSSAPVGLGILVNRHFLEVNDRTLQMLGYSREELIGQHIRKLYENDEEYERAGRMNYQPARAEGIGWNKTRWRQKNGTFLDVLISTIPLDKNDESIGNIFTMTDLTELEQTQEHLQDRLRFEGMLSTVSRLFAQMDVGYLESTFQEALELVGRDQKADRAYLFELDPDHGTMSNTVEWVNEGVKAVKETLQDLPTSVFPWWIRTLREEGVISITDVAAMPPEAEVERQTLTDQGIVSAMITGLFLDNELVGFLGLDRVKESRTESERELELLRFIGELFSSAMLRREKAAAIQKEQERLLNVLNNAPMGVLAIDLIDDIPILCFANEESNRMLGIDVNELLGLNVQEAFPTLSGELVEKIRERAISGERASLEIDYKDHRFSGHYQIWTNSLAKGKLALFFVDMTKINLLNEQLVLANKKLTLLGKLTRHDANNKILTIRGNLEMLRLKADPHLFKRYIDGVEKGTSDISEIMETMNHYMGIGTEKMGWIDLGEAVGSTLRRLELDDQLLPSIYVEKDFNAYDVQADRLLPMVLYNLLSNSIKHGGTIDNIRLSAVVNDGELWMTVEDNGQGVPEELQGHIFDFDLKGRLGHGLNFIKEVLDVYDMSIEYAGQPGKGAKFTIKVPAGKFRSKG